MSAIAHKTVLHHISSLTSEAAVEAVFLAVCLTHACPTQAYDPIVAAGTNASILHYAKDNANLRGKTLLCMDAGAEFQCYSSDVTRTFPLTTITRTVKVIDPASNSAKSGALQTKSGPPVKVKRGILAWPNPHAEALYALVERMQEACLAACGPGVYFSNLFRLAQRIAVHGLLDLGVLRIPNDDGVKNTDKSDAEHVERFVEDFIDSGYIYAFFPHGLGHHMGLDVHDIGPIGTMAGVKAKVERMQDSVTGKGVRRMPVPPIPHHHHRLLPAHSTSSSSTSPPQFPSFSSEPQNEKEEETPLEPGMIITIEPGLYFNAYALSHLYLPHLPFAKLINRPVLDIYVTEVGGVRIEDDVLITADGIENLTLSEGAVKGKEMLEVIHAGERCGHKRGECPFPVFTGQ